MHEHELQRNALAKGEVLLVATSASQFANGEKTGAWLSEIAVPFSIFKRAGYDVTIASPQGGQVPVDDASLRNLQTEGDVVSNLVHTFQHDDTARQMMQSSVPLEKVEHVNNYRVVFLAGGHGATIDYPSTPKLQQIVTDALNCKDVVVAVVCHGSAVFASEQLGKAISGRRVTGFSDEEERSVGRDGSVPFLLESRLRELGANVSVGAPGVEHVVVDGNLMTGQNPASAGKLAQSVVSYLQSHPVAGAAAHPGTYTAEEVPMALGVAPLLPGYGSLAPPGGDTSQQVSKEVSEPNLYDNLGPNAEPNPGTYTGNDTPAAG